MYQILDGRKVSAEIKEEIKLRVQDIVAKGGRKPHLGALLVGHDGGSETYVASKVKAC